MISPHLKVVIDLSRIRRNAEEIKARTHVELWATIKADAYGLGAAQVAGALAGAVDGFCIFALHEAWAIELFTITGKEAIALGPPEEMDSAVWIEARVRPAVSTAGQARQLLAARPILCVDTGMQRFACPAEQIESVLSAGQIDQAFTHAIRVDQARALKALLGGRNIKLHAAASALLDHPEARLDAVRPGLALYLGAVRATARLVEARDSAGPVGYGQWPSPTGRHGIILAGYSNGLRPGPVMVNGRRQKLIEVGMQTAYVTLAASDNAGDEVVLLGGGITEAEVGFAWGTTPHQAIMQIARHGVREYIG